MCYTEKIFDTAAISDISEGGKKCLGLNLAKLITMHSKDFQTKGHVIKRLDVCNCWYLEPLDLLHGLALGCYQPSPEVWFMTNQWRVLIQTLSWRSFMDDFNIVSLLESIFIFVELISKRKDVRLEYFEKVELVMLLD